jgi:hypothetical protein
MGNCTIHTPGKTLEIGGEICGSVHRKASLCLWTIFALVPGVPMQAATLLVGPTRTYTTPCAAIAAASSGDIIEIDPALYERDMCAWTTDNSTLVGVLASDGSRPHLDADNKNAQGKGIKASGYPPVAKPGRSII